VQYFTSTAGTVQSYNFIGGKYLQSQVYNNCIRTAKGYCKIQWKESSTTTPDPFTIGATTNADATGCLEIVRVPGLSPDGVLPIPVPTGTVTQQDDMCGTVFGIEGVNVPQALVSDNQPFLLGVNFGTGSPATASGFNLDYTQLAC